MNLILQLRDDMKIHIRELYGVGAYFGSSYLGVGTYFGGAGWGISEVRDILVVLCI